MAQPSTLNPLSGPLAGKHLEFHGADVMIGSASDCAVRIDAPGVEAHHARIVIDAIGATIYRGDGPVGVNDDLVEGDARLRSGDFVWIGVPAGENSIMLQFTLGDGEPAPTSAPVLVEEAYVEAAPAEELMEEMAPEELAPATAEGIDEVLVEEAAPAALEPATEAVEVMEPAVEPALEFDTSHEDPVPFEAPVEHAEMMEAPEPQPMNEIEASFDEPAPFVPPSEAPAAPTASSPKVPPAPWQMAAAPEPAPAPADYASAWESPAKPAAAPEPEPAPAPAPPPAPKPTPPPAPRPPSQTGAIKRPASSPPAKGKAADALRTPVPPPPPARTTSSTPMIVGGLVAVLLLAAGGAYFLSSGSPAPAPQKPTPAPTAVAVATPPPAVPEPTLEATPEAPVATPEPAALATPAQAAAGAPTPRPTAAPRTTPTPAPSRSTAATPAASAPTPAPAAAVVNPAPKLVEEARAAVAAKDLARAGQLFDQALKADPGNSAATAGKAEVTARLAVLGRKFSMGATNTLGGKAAKGPTGFDLGGGGAVKADISGQIRCTMAPASVEPGTRYTLQCSLLNIGAKGFKVEGVTGTENVDNTPRGAAAGSVPKQEVAPRAEAVIFETSGSWTANTSWRFEILVKTNKDESFRAAYNWR